MSSTTHETEHREVVRDSRYYLIGLSLMMVLITVTTTLIFADMLTEFLGLSGKANVYAYLIVTAATALLVTVLLYGLKVYGDLKFQDGVLTERARARDEADVRQTDA